MDINDPANGVAIKMQMHIAKETDKFVQQVVPKWFWWAINKGGLLRKIARVFIKVVIIEKQVQMTFDDNGKLPKNRFTGAIRNFSTLEVIRRAYELGSGRRESEKDKHIIENFYQSLKRVG